MIKVSVIVPVYNAEKYIKECLESLINQSLQDIEIICIDDNSSDNSLLILNEYEHQDGRIKVIRNKKNIGAAESRNIGLFNAKGKYIQFVDADDYIEKTALEELFSIAEMKNADMCYLGMQFDVSKNTDLSMLQSSIAGEYQGVFKGTDLINIFTENKEFFLYLWSVFYKNSFLKEFGLQFRPLIIGEGGNLILRALCCAQRVIVCPGRYYHYRIHETSITHMNNAKKELLVGQIVQYIDVLQYFSQNDKTEGLDNFLRSQYKKVVGGIQGLSFSDKHEIAERLDTEFAKHVFYMLQQDNKLYGLQFTEEIIQRIQKKEFVIIYGAGYASKEIIELLQQYDIEILGFAVTKRNAAQKSMYGHHIYEIQELVFYHERAIVLVTANKKYNQEIRDTLIGYQFFDSIFLDVEI